MTDFWHPADPRRSPANDPWPEDLTRAYHRMRADLDAVVEIEIHFKGSGRVAAQERVRGEHETAMLERMERDDYAV